VKGNHEYTIARSQDRWRTSDRAAQLAQVGQVVNDETLVYISSLPDTARPCDACGMVMPDKR
jgi:hypothetical protein